MSSDKFVLDMTALKEGFRQLGVAAAKAAKSFEAFGHTVALDRMLVEQARIGRRKRKVYLISFALAVVWSYFVFALPMSAPWVTLASALPTGWLILDQFYWLTYWDNYTNEVEATRRELDHDAASHGDGAREW